MPLAHYTSASKCNMGWYMYQMRDCSLLTIARTQWTASCSFGSRHWLIVPHLHIAFIFLFSLLEYLLGLAHFLICTTVKALAFIIRNYYAIQAQHRNFVYCSTKMWSGLCTRSTWQVCSSSTNGERWRWGTGSPWNLSAFSRAWHAVMLSVPKRGWRSSPPPTRSRSSCLSIA